MHLCVYVYVYAHVYVMTYYYKLVLIITKATTIIIIVVTYWKRTSMYKALWLSLTLHYTGLLYGINFNVNTPLVLGM